MTISSKGSITVRKVISPTTKRTFYGVGIITDGKWTVLRDDPAPLYYKSRKKALACAAHLREARSKA